MAKLYDAFLFGGELDMLECRLYELQDSPIYRHVIVESPVTFTGHPKPLLYEEHKERFAPWKDRIRYVVASPQGPGAWEREYQSREAIRAGLGDADPSDIVMMSDCDEIPPPWALENPASLVPSVFINRCAVFAVDWEMPERTWRGTVVQQFWAIGSFQALRGGPGLAEVPGGWHLSWMGGHAAMHAKVRAFSHQEMLAEISEGIDAGRYYERGVFWGWHGHPQPLLPVEVDSSWPRWVAEHKCPSSWFRPQPG